MMECVHGKKGSVKDAKVGAQLLQTKSGITNQLYFVPVLYYQDCVLTSRRNFAFGALNDPEVNNGDITRKISQIASCCIEPLFHTVTLSTDSIEPLRKCDCHQYHQCPFTSICGGAFNRLKLPNDTNN